MSNLRYVVSASQVYGTGLTPVACTEQCSQRLSTQETRSWQQ